MAETIITRHSADADCHTHYSRTQEREPVTVIRPDATAMDLVVWACGEVDMLKRLAGCWDDLDGKLIDAHTPLSVLQAISQRLGPTLSVLERANDMLFSAREAMEVHHG